MLDAFPVYGLLLPEVSPVTGVRYPDLPEVLIHILGARLDGRPVPERDIRYPAGPGREELPAFHDDIAQDDPLPRLVRPLQPPLDLHPGRGLVGRHRDLAVLGLEGIGR